jgi:hypothetical protein
MIEIDLRVELQIEGPFLNKSSTVGSFGVDSVPLRDFQGRPIIPRSQFKGRLKEQIAIFSKASLSAGPQISRWMGMAPDIESDRTDAMAKQGLRTESWYFSDLVATTPSASPRTITRIQMDSERGSVKSGALQVIECGIEPGIQITFSGLVTVVERDQTRLELTDALGIYDFSNLAPRN